MNLAGPLGAAAAYSHRLMVDAEVWREETTTDAGGGQTVAWVQQDPTDVQLVSPSATERETAAQWGVEVTHTAVVPLDSHVVRGDRLVVAGATVELVSDPLAATHSAVGRALARQEPWKSPTEE